MTYPKTKNDLDNVPPSQRGEEWTLDFIEWIEGGCLVD